MEPLARWLVDKNEDGSRLDRALIRRCGEGRKGLIMRLIRKGNVRVDGKRAQPSTRLVAGNEIYLPASLREPEEAKTMGSGLVWRRGQDKKCAKQALTPYMTIYEDAQLLVVDKPAGAVVHGGSGYTSGLIEQIKLVRGLPDLRLAHRLDRDTSGCLLLVKELAALRAVAASFRDHEAEKSYFAWVMGWMEDQAGRMRSHLSKGVVRGGERMVVDAGDGKEAVTDFQLVLRTEIAGLRLSLVALMPHHGRTHQLRVQLAQEGHAIAGDGKYGTADDLRAFRAIGGKGMALHAWRLRLRHPDTGLLLDFRAPWPKRWRWVHQEA
ncbi:MAG: RluA family pseudouridine synthase [Mariprofundales bacterium]|nr:RluA family pseudouridine synthase [Mariprofundales bacterium]